MQILQNTIGPWEYFCEMVGQCLRKSAPRICKCSWIFLVAGWPPDTGLTWSYANVGHTGHRISGSLHWVLCMAWIG